MHNNNYEIRSVKTICNSKRMGVSIRLSIPSKHAVLFCRQLYQKGENIWEDFKSHIRQSSCDEFHDSPRCQTVIRGWYKRQVRLAICSCHRSSQPSLGVKPLQ
jgi:N-glycosylase/DNA lyase